MKNNRVESLAGLALAGVLIVAVAGLLMMVLMLFSGEWVAAGLFLIGASIPFSVLLYLLYK